MKLDIYVNYKGCCREAFGFYEQHLNGKITSMETFSKMPGISDERKNDILHARIAIGGTTVMGADIPHAELMRSAYLTLTFGQPQEAEKAYELLCDGGEIFMKMEETPFALRFAMLRDRFGTSWMLLCERA